MISTRDLSGIPTVSAVRRLLKSLAMLDAVVCPDWQFRYFSFNCRWAPGEQMGSMRNGQGEHFFALFNSAGCWLKGFDHELAASARFAGVLDHVPQAFASCMAEPAFTVDDTTFCIWRRHSDASWQRGPIDFPIRVHDPDGSARLLRWLDGQPQTYRRWAEAYYERPVSASVVAAIYAHQPLDDDIIRALNADLTVGELAADAEEIGYPEAELSTLASAAIPS